MPARSNSRAGPYCIPRTSHRRDRWIHGPDRRAGHRSAPSKHDWRNDCAVQSRRNARQDRTDVGERLPPRRPCGQADPTSWFPLGNRLATGTSKKDALRRCITTKGHRHVRVRLEPLYKACFPLRKRKLSARPIFLRAVAEPTQPDAAAQRPAPLKRGPKDGHRLAARARVMIAGASESKRRGRTATWR